MTPQKCIDILGGRCVRGSCHRGVSQYVTGIKYVGDILFRGHNKGRMLYAEEVSYAGRLVAGAGPIRKGAHH